MHRHHLSARRAGFHFSALALALFGLPLMAAAQPATEHVNVVGQAASIDKSLKEQRRSDSVKSVVSADGVAQLPDENVAEAVQRLPGVSVERDQGEGRFVSVRGLGPDLNAVTINGTLIPSPNADSRAVALDVLPAELVQSLSVVKTLTPDMDANSLGGTVEVQSLSAFDHDGLFYTLGAEGSHDDNTGKNSPKLSGAVSQRFSLGGGKDNFGVALAGSWGKRDFGSDNVETGGAWDFADGAKLESFEQRDYQISRERAGLGANFDFRPDDYNSYFLRTLHSRFTDEETRQSANVSFDDAQAPGERGTARIERRIKDREETQEISSVVLGSQHLMQSWTLDTQLGWSRASEDTPEHLASARFRNLNNFNNVGFSDSRKPELLVGSDFYNLNAYRFQSAELAKQYTEDEERNIKLDLARDYELSGHAAQLKFGGKLSRRDKDNDIESWTYSRGDLNAAGIPNAQLLLGGYAGGNVDYALGGFGRGISASAVRALLANVDRASVYNEENSRIGDFKISEDINAAYLMHSVDIDDLRLLAGVRYEGTRQRSKGTGLRDGVFESTDNKNDYHHWLPGLHARYQLDKNTQLRAAWTNTVVRPTFEQIAPGFLIDGDEAEFGNPDLKPLESSNLDLGIERYLGRAGVVSAFVFYKDIDNFVYNTDLAGTGAWAAFDEAATFANGDSAKLYGLELAWSQKFDWLPAPWNGVLVGANATFSRSDARISGFDAATGQQRKRDIDLPVQSDRVGNLMLGWENDKLSLRLSANYKSDALIEVASISEPFRDVRVDDQVFVDFSARYNLTPELQLSFEAQNLTDEHYYTYTGSRRYNAQYEEYGPTYRLGVTLSHF